MTTTLNRREAIALFIAATSLPFLPAAARAARTAGATQPSVARAAVIHDALLLLATDRDVTGEWQDVLLPLPVQKPWEFSYAYGVASIDDDGQLVRDVVQEVRSGWKTRAPAFMDLQRHKGGMLERHLIVALGWAANHGAAPILLADVAGPEAALAVDGALIRALAGSPALNASRVERWLRVLYERTLVAMHTIEPDIDGEGGLDIASMHEIKNPDQDDANRFIDAYADWIESVDRRCRALAKAVAAPPPDGLPMGDKFYRRSDPIIAAIENLRRGVGVSNTPGTWTEKSGTSRYGQAVAAAYANARLVLDTARGEKSVIELETMFEG